MAQRASPFDHRDRPATPDLETEKPTGQMEQDGFEIVRNYYDIMLIGRTGRGKSSLGNKLLHAKIDLSSNDRSSNGLKPKDYSSTHVAVLCAQFDKGVAMPDKCHPNLRFATADDDDIPNDRRILSITQTCKFIGNERTMVRVLDTPGFYPSSVESKDMPHMTMAEANLQIFRWIVREQLDKNNNMHIKRVLYFYPDRGIPQKADGVLQGELSILYTYFGAAVFGHMVVIATQNREYQKFSFDKEQCDEVQKIFTAGVKAATQGELSECSAPVVYIGLNDNPDEILKKIQEVPVYSGSPCFVPAFRDSICSRCSGEIRYCKASSGDIPVGVQKCDKYEKYNDSKCHPCFIRKYSNAEKIAGGFGHVATLGIPYGVAKVLHKESWPSFFNSDEMCPHCRGLPGTKGCLQVEEQVEVDGQVLTVRHTNNF